MVATRRSIQQHPTVGYLMWLFWKSTSQELSCLFLALLFKFSTKPWQSLCELTPQLSCKASASLLCKCLLYVSVLNGFLAVSCVLSDPFLWHSAVAASHQSSFGRVGAPLSILLKSLWLADTFLPFQAPFLPSPYSSLANVTVKFHLVRHCYMSFAYFFLLSASYLIPDFVSLFLSTFPSLSL